MAARPILGGGGLPGRGLGGSVGGLAPRSLATSPQRSLNSVGAQSGSQSSQGAVSPLRPSIQGYSGRDGPMSSPMASLRQPTSATDPAKREAVASPLREIRPLRTNIPGQATQNGAAAGKADAGEGGGRGGYLLSQRPRPGQGQSAHAPPEEGGGGSVTGSGLMRPGLSPRLGQRDPRMPESSAMPERQAPGVASAGMGAVSSTAPVAREPAKQGHGSGVQQWQFAAGAGGTERGANPPPRTMLPANFSRGGQLSPPARPGAPGPSAGSSSAAERNALQARVAELERLNAEAEKRLDDDGKQFLEALLSLEGEVEELTKQNKGLVDERSRLEEQLKRQGSDGELRAKNLRLERECQDMLQQLDEFEKEKEDELSSVRAEVKRLEGLLVDQEREFQRRLQEAERERANLLSAMTEEGRELQARVQKLESDKEALSMDLAKALARADVMAAAGGGGGGGDAHTGGPADEKMRREMTEVSKELRSVTSEREKLKDEVTDKEGQIVLLKSQLVIRDRKLRIADMENQMLKSELEVYRRGAPLGEAVVAGNEGVHGDLGRLTAA
eukprot:TRINITY_DN30103_c0_g1_i1.p1 TRINITY_DN30103_c0_g1~~TRINITY_DN30103_c0_g1_i1.p1  ORF type:complete len:598 (-),score=150.98 TRINITY_DN30103_c0_g1_i1:109-1785(-)